MNHLSINELQNQVVDEFYLLGEDWTEKYNYIIDYGKRLPQLSEQYKTEENLVRGCQSRVWMHSYLQNGKVIFEAESDAIITKGLVGLLVRVLSNQIPDDIVHADLFFIDKIGMKEHLSPTRSNGLFAMIKQMKLYALGFKTKQENIAK